jgi:indole-3-acetate monooxygenase
MTAEVGNQVVARARTMRDVVRAEAAESERMRTLTHAIVDEMWATGLMSSFNPRAAGGEEPSFTEMIETWIEMAWQDGSFGWVGIANLPSTFAAAAYLPDEGFQRCSPPTTTGSRWAVSSFRTARVRPLTAATG